mgnify:CR=1 FL=1
MSQSVRTRGRVNVAAGLVECDPTELNAGDRVLDVDQLSGADHRAFLAAVGGTGREIETSDLESGDVVKYTGYYRVV